jgi:hypothetical protein
MVVLKYFRKLLYLEHPCPVSLVLLQYFKRFHVPLMGYENVGRAREIAVLPLTSTK